MRKVFPEEWPVTCTKGQFESIGQGPVPELDFLFVTLLCAITRLLRDE